MELTDLPLLPRDDDGPVFAEPWQAQAFAVVAELIESGKISRDEWAQKLGAQFKEAEANGDYDTGARYYDHWLAALERLVIEKGFTDENDLVREKEQIRENDHHRREHQLNDDN